MLVREGDPEGNPWQVSFLRMLDMANDSGLFRSREDLEAAGARLEGNVFERDGERWLPLYEAKMIHQFDHRFGTYEGQTQAQANQGKLPEFDDAQHADPNLVVLPRYWVAESEVASRLEGRWDRGWLLGWRDICRTSDARTVISAIVPAHRRWAQAAAVALASPGVRACRVGHPLSLRVRLRRPPEDRRNLT